MIGRQLTGLALILALTAPASARIEQWTANGAGSQITVTDCADCEEDFGILLTCQGAGNPAKMYIPYMAFEEDPVNRRARQKLAPIVFTVDGQQFQYAPSFELWGMIGHVPYVHLDATDPLVAALQAGRYVDVFVEGGSVQFPLTGASAAFAAFSQNCPWGAGSQPQVGQPQIAQPQVGQPQIGQPQIGQPQIAQPQIGQPQVGQPQIAQPQIGQPQIGQPQIGQPQIGQPQIGQPQIGQPQIAQPQVGQPQIGQPQIGQPQIGQPQIGQPQIGQPQIGQPQITQPQVGQPQVGQPQPVRLPFETRSGGGKVRGGPSMNDGQVGSTRAMDPITLLEEVPNSMMNGFPWFRIRYSGGEGYQWGGIICRPRGVPLAGTYGECDL